MKREFKNRKSEKGQSLTEFGLMAPLFALLLFGGIQMIFLPYQQMMMEKATWSGCRAAVTSTWNDDAFIRDKMAKVVGNYNRFGFFGEQVDIRTMDKGAMGDMKYMVLVVPHRMFYGLGGQYLGSNTWEKYLGAGSSASRGGSMENFAGPLPQRDLEEF